MFEALAMHPQFDIYHTSIQPIIQSVQKPSQSLMDERYIKELLMYAKQTDFILSTFIDIIDELNFDKVRFEEVISTLDDDYEELKKLHDALKPSLPLHKELYEITDKILDNLVKAQFQMGSILSSYENQPA